MLRFKEIQPHREFRPSLKSSSIPVNPGARPHRILDRLIVPCIKVRVSQAAMALTASICMHANPAPCYAASEVPSFVNIFINIFAWASILLLIATGTVFYLRRNRINMLCWHTRIPLVGMIGQCLPSLLTFQKAEHCLEALGVRLMDPIHSLSMDLSSKNI